MSRVAVVGGGPAGLAAGLALAEAGVDVTVFEAAQRPGGGMRTEVLEGAPVDMGVQLVSSTHEALFAAVRLAGAADMLQRSPGRDALWRKGRAQGITYGSIASMISSGALPTSLKLRLGTKYLPFLASRAASLDANDPAATGGVALDDESIAAWGRRELGDDFVELLAYPLLAAYYGAAPEETGAAVYHALAKVGMEVRVYGARGGFGALAGALARGIQARGGWVYASREVRQVEWGDDDVAIDGDAFDAAILAVPAPVARTLLGDGAPDVAQWLASVRARDALTLALRLDREFPGDYFGLSFPRVVEHGRNVAVLCMQRRKLPELVPTGDAVVVIPSPPAAERLYHTDDALVAKMLLRDADAAMPGLSQRVTSWQVSRFPAGYTLFPPGHLRHVRSFPATAVPPRLALAGDYLVAPSVEGAIRSGNRAARRVLDLLGKGGAAG
jgi:protoporphyrinogen/coproporphyrinogen III oxidase